MTIYEIKKRTYLSNPYYFNSRTMKSFNQTLKDFSVKKQLDGRYLISAPMRNNKGIIIGYSERFFNPLNNSLEFN